MSTGLCPGIVSSLDVAHSLIQPGICLFTWGRHKEIRGVREGEKFREELRSHIWVDGTHGESTLEWSAVSPRFSCKPSPALYVPQPFLICSSKITTLCPSFHLYPSSSSLPHLNFVFLPHQITMYSLQSPPLLSKAIPDVALWAPIAFCHFFILSYRKWAPFRKKGIRDEGRES